jgi:hypothetical protein
MQILSNAFTSAFKELDPLSQFRGTAKLGPLPETVPVRGPISPTQTQRAVLPYCSLCLYAGARETFEVLLVGRCDLGGVDRMQHNFEPTRKQADLWRQSELTGVTAKMIIYQEFIESELEAPRHLARRLHDLCFDPQYDKSKPGTVWSWSNAPMPAFKDLADSVCRATSKPGAFLELASNRVSELRRAHNSEKFR